MWAKATGVSKLDESQQCASLLWNAGEVCQDIHSTWTFGDDENDKIKRLKDRLTLTGLQGHICPSLVKGLEGRICHCVVTSWWRNCDVI